MTGSMNIRQENTEKTRIIDLLHIISRYKYKEISRIEKTKLRQGQSSQGQGGHPIQSASVQYSFNQRLKTYQEVGFGAALGSSRAGLVIGMAWSC